MADVDVDVPSAAPVVGSSMDINLALQEVLKQSLRVDGLVHGIHQACKALDKRQAVLCILAESFEEPLYKKLITALCNEHRIPLIRVDSHKKLGEWSGLCKIDKEGKPRKVCGCSVVVIKDYGEETPALDVVKEHLRQSS
ncbi:40S ribosomal protein S12 [Condylostylus longicornis]|uniref:40S ribosomal protein S12 n=1 Tax=Condylostylus longicornis TaxID=2530218 RepID=UPI00244DD1CE|nr:40S ribosomal protein S12 [Condylostylus longicornis]